MTERKAKVAFARRNDLRTALRERVNAYFESNNIKPNDNPEMYLKTATIFTWVLSAWLFLLFGPPILSLQILGCVVLGLGLAACGMCVGHDANHGSYSKNPLVNRIFGFAFDFIGVSGFLWRFRHNKLHHIYTNLPGHDVEVDGEGAVRMSPDVPLLWHHKFQHIFIWFLYPFIPFYWFMGDMRRFIFRGQYLGHQIPKPSRSEIIDFVGMRIFSFCFFIVTPLLVGHSLLEIAIAMTISHMVYGFVVCEIFMLAHVVESAAFPGLDPETNYVDKEWAVLQVETAADFAPRNPILNWYVGGLNYQVIHHLFPDICHIHYPQIAGIVAEVCQEHGIQYNVYDTFGGAIASNYRWLKRLGQSPVAAVG